MVYLLRNCKSGWPFCFCFLKPKDT
jgi:hypothetical protein